MNKTTTILLTIVIQFAIRFPTVAQSLTHNFEDKHVVTVSGNYNYFQPRGKSKWLFPFLAYQRNIRLDNYQGDRNKLHLQLGTAITPTNTMDDNVDSSRYVLMMPGYINPFVSFYAIQEVGRKRFALHANFSTGFKLLPFSTISSSKAGNNDKTSLHLADSTFLQYYFGVGAGISFKRFVDFNIQYNRIYHDVTDETREKFRGEYPNGYFHGSYFDLSLRAHPYTNKRETWSAFAEFEWRVLGRSYQYNKTVAYGVGVLIKPRKRTSYEKLSDGLKSLDARMVKLKKTGVDAAELGPVRERLEGLKNKKVSSKLIESLSKELKEIKAQVEKLENGLKQSQSGQ